MAGYLQLIGAVISIVGSLKEGSQQEGAADIQASLEESRAIAEETRTADLEAQRRRQARSLVGTQKAQFAAAGVRQEGTPLLVMQQTLLDAEEDVLRTKATGSNRVFAFQTQARRFRDIGSTAKQKGFGKAGSSLITAIGDFIT